MIILIISLLFALSGLYLFFKIQSRRYIGLAMIAITGLIIINSVCEIFSVPFFIPCIINCIAAIGLLYFILIEIKIIGTAQHTQFHDVDYLIVNGAKLYGSTPSPSLQDRMEGTLHFMQSNQNAIAVLTGRKWPYSDVSEAYFMYNCLIAHNIDKNRLILEENASNTLENIRFSLNRIQQDIALEDVRIGILTSDYHLYRALYIAKAEQITAVGIAIPTRRFLSKTNYFIREAFAMTEIYIFGVEGI